MECCAVSVRGGHGERIPKTTLAIGRSPSRIDDQRGRGCFQNASLNGEPLVQIIRDDLNPRCDLTIFENGQNLMDQRRSVAVRSAGQ